ncbi:MBL fold metallo-hydrolase [bacterium]|nr:MBL fold metallo-hydrolase [bacterium]
MPVKKPFWIETLIRAELYHALDNNMAAEKLISAIKDPQFSFLRKALSGFYIFMDRRFSCKDIQYDFSNNISAINEEFIQKLDLDVGSDPEALEDQIIRDVYLLFVEVLKKIQSRLEHESVPNREAFGKLITEECEGRFNSTVLLDEIRERVEPYVSFENDRIKAVKDKTREILTAKIDRYLNKYDRIKFYKSSNVLDKDVRRTFYTKDNLVIFVIYLLTKYQINLHAIVHNKNAELSEILTDYSAKQKDLERCQYIFTFTRLLSKYIVVNTENRRYALYAYLFQVLSLLRRGYTFMLLNKYEQAFNDYTYAEKHLRMLKPKYEKKTKKKGKEENNELIDLCNKFIYPLILCYKGELYRRDYAYANAFQYYCSAVVRFGITIDNTHDSNPDEQMEFLLGGYAAVKALTNKGKTFLEMGEFRRALKWFLKSLGVAISIHNNRVNKVVPFALDTLDEMLAFLEDTKFDPVIDKEQLYVVLSRLTKTFSSYVRKKSFQDPDHDLCILISDLTNRIGLVLNLLNIPDVHESRMKERVIRNRLAYEWLCMSICLHRENALAHFNRMIFNCIAQYINYQFTEFGSIDTKYKIAEFAVSTCEFDAGEIFERLNRQFAMCVVNSLQQLDLEQNDDYRRIVRKLLFKYFSYTHNFATKNAEIYKYLMRPKTIDLANRFVPEELYICFLQRWSSFTPAIPRPSTFNIQGGGYFIIFNGKGIVIDPGFDFLENFYSEGFSLADIDVIIVTHDHMDHLDDLDTILSLLHSRFALDTSKEDRKQIDLFFNLSVQSRYSFLLNQAESSDADPFYKLHVLTPGSTGFYCDNDGKKLLDIDVIQTHHSELAAQDYSIGVILYFYLNGSKKEKAFKIGYTSDTAYMEGASGQLDVWEKMKIHGMPNLCIMHINSTPFRELKNALDLEIENSESTRNVLKLAAESDNKDLKLLADQFLYSYWYRNDEIPKMSHVEEDRVKLGDHLFFKGVYSVLKNVIKSNSASKEQKLLIISEFREEMGSYRNKVAHFLNEDLVRNDEIKCISADIGLVIRCLPKTGKMFVRCSLCNLNNDYDVKDKYYHPSEMKEVCLKGEDEGLFYFCKYHDPEPTHHQPNPRKLPKSEFAEKIERYHLFKQVNIR